MNAKDLEELAGKCEAATGPDRELDLAIDCVVRPTQWSAKVKETLNPGCPLDYFDGEELPHYTASIDAALSLAEGFGGEVTFFKDGTAKAFLWQPYPIAVAANAATPALALCAAALRARASQ